MFSENDLVFYPAQGVGRVEHIQNKDLGGVSCLLYVVRMLSNDATLLVPVDNADKVGLRSLVPPETARTILDGLYNDTDRPVPGGQNWNRRFREYTDRLKQSDLETLASVLQFLLVQGKTKELSFGERRLQEHALDLVLGELSQVLDIPEATMRQELVQRYMPAGKERQEDGQAATVAPRQPS
ncbi:MAG: CarD family transcriptional regulator [Desulfovibrio sp.]|jgi:CarD family transcriptional regulator|nr:CarD family transcriptional regulator [Desulfovibrio sp.]